MLKNKNAMKENHTRGKKNANKSMSNTVKNAAFGLSVFGTAVMTADMPVYAAANPALAPLTSLKTIMTGVVAAIGTLVVIKNIMELSSAIQNQDSSGVTAALKGLAGGALMAGVGTVLTILGIS